MVVGFSIGGCVALEMAASGAFKGPMVLLGISLSAADEPAFFHVLVRLGDVLGGLPAAAMAKGVVAMVSRLQYVGRQARGPTVSEASRERRRD